MAQRLTNRLVSRRTQLRSQPSFSGLRIQHCHELWCRSQMWLRSGVAVAVAVAGSCPSNLTPSLWISICHGCSLKRQGEKKTILHLKKKKCWLWLFKDTLEKTVNNACLLGGKTVIGGRRFIYYWLPFRILSPVHEFKKQINSLNTPGANYLVCTELVCRPYRIKFTLFFHPTPKASWLFWLWPASFPRFPLYPQCSLHSAAFSWTFFTSSFPHLFFFRALLRQEVPRLGVESELQLIAYTIAQQCWIWATSATYTTTFGNTRSLTHWARPGIEPASSWILGRFWICWNMTGTPSPLPSLEPLPCCCLFRSGSNTTNELLLLPGVPHSIVGEAGKAWNFRAWTQKAKSLALNSGPASYTTI